MVRRTNDLTLTPLRSAHLDAKVLQNAAKPEWSTSALEQAELLDQALDEVHAPPCGNLAVDLGRADAGAAGEVAKVLDLARELLAQHGSEGVEVVRVKLDCRGLAQRRGQPMASALLVRPA